jgi:hypothetical protein
LSKSSRDIRASSTRLVWRQDGDRASADSDERRSTVAGFIHDLRGADTTRRADAAGRDYELNALCRRTRAPT